MNKVKNYSKLSIGNYPHANDGLSLEEKLNFKHVNAFEFPLVNKKKKNRKHGLKERAPLADKVPSNANRTSQTRKQR